MTQSNKDRLKELKHQKSGQAKKFVSISKTKDTKSGVGIQARRIDTAFKLIWVLAQQKDYGHIVSPMEQAREILQHLLEKERQSILTVIEEILEVNIADGLYDYKG